MLLSVCPNPSVDKFINLAYFKPGEVNKSLNEKSYPGGKGVHVALAAKELGYESYLAGLWGGPTGQWIKNMCENQGIQCTGQHIESWTRTCLTIKSQSKFNDTEIVEQGPHIDEKILSDFFKSVSKLSDTATIVCVSGSWPLGSPDDVYERIHQRFNSPGQSLWVDASGERLQQAVQINPFGIHVNRAEAATLFGPAKPPVQYAKQLLSYCNIAAVTDGANGLYLATKNEVYHAYCKLDQVISAVGSGDCLLAGLMVSQYEKKSNKEMAITAVACGAANCLRPELGMLFKKDVLELRNKVICKKMDD